MSQKIHRYYVYIVASRTHVLYCGFTNNLERRVAQHKSGSVPGFTERYNCTRLVWFERYQYVNRAIAREKQIKAWTRERKLSLINEMNPTWADLSAAWGKQIEAAAEVSFGRRDSRESSGYVTTLPNSAAQTEAPANDPKRDQ